MKGVKNTNTNSTNASPHCPCSFPTVVRIYPLRITVRLHCQTLAAPAPVLECASSCGSSHVSLPVPG
ncbi:hypothetical protein CGRA01v4_10511 [Colletotrichum graminicola]|nr:hypothetical protein CGRA01v4_10511 [Colletotrichum graminicola]